MKCCLCGCEIEGWGNNPYPVIKEENARCCDDCNAILVIASRMISAGADHTINTDNFVNMSDEEIKNVIGGRQIVLFHSADVSIYNEGIVHSGLFAEGVVEEVEGTKAKGDWGNFAINLLTDSYIIQAKE